MKKLLLCTLLLALLLFSCTNIFLEIIDTEEPVNGSHSTEDSPSTPVENPESYPGVPTAYKSILDALFLLEEQLTREEFGSGDELEIVGFMEYPYPRGENLGYTVVDINGDGVPELLLGTVYGLQSAQLNSIFTIIDGKPVLLKSFWSRSRGVISADGVIFSTGSGGAAYTYLSSYKLDKNADTLTELTDIRSDYSFSDEKPYYVQVVDGEDQYISEDEFWNLLEMYDNPPDPMKLTVIPISN